MMGSKAPKRKRNRDDKFRPTDLEVIQKFLEPKVNGKAVAGEGEFIVSHNVYATRPESLNWNPVPWLPDNERFYFVKRKPLSSGLDDPKNADRTVESGEGYWRKSRKYKIKEGEITKGYYDLMNFWEYKPGGDKTGHNSVKIRHFLMHEFYLPGSSLQQWVVCLVRYKVGKKQQQMIPLPPAMALLAPPKADQQPAPEETYDLMIEDDGTCNVSESLLLQPLPDEWKGLTPPSEEAIIMEDSTLTTMEVDEYTWLLNELDRQEKEDAKVVEAIEHQEEEDDYVDDAWLVEELERPDSQPQHEDVDSDDDGWLVDAMERPDSDIEPDSTTNMETKSEEHQQEEDVDDAWLVEELERPDSQPQHEDVDSDDDGWLVDAMERPDSDIEPDSTTNMDTESIYI